MEPVDFWLKKKTLLLLNNFHTLKNFKTILNRPKMFLEYYKQTIRPLILQMQVIRMTNPRKMEFGIIMVVTGINIKIGQI